MGKLLELEGRVAVLEAKVPQLEARIVRQEKILMELQGHARSSAKKLDELLERSRPRRAKR